MTAQRLTAGLRGQALTSAPNTQLTLGSDPLFISSFTDRSTNIRHIQATFSVTNTGSTPLDNLIFLPTVTTDTDNDPSNNATPPTIAGTPFRTVEFFDGSDASSRAPSLVLGRGQLLNAASGQVTDDPAASPFLNGLDVSGVVPVPPTGLSASVTQTGWQVSPSLAPGQSANVTFAVDERDADPNNPKNDPYRFSLLVAAAQSDAASAVGTINPGVIRGTVSDSALFGGKAVLVNGVSVPSTQFNATATVGAAGNINLPLGVPPSGDFSAALPPQGDPCTYSGTVSDSSARIAQYAGMLASGAQADPVATMQEVVVSGAKVPGAIVSRVYVNAPLVLKAKVNCSNRPYTIDYDVTLNLGWNAVEISGNNSALVMKNLNPDARSTLKVTRRTPGVTVSLSDTSVINLKPGERVTRNASFLQVGAYSGTVSLSTNVPGVSVEPSTVTLGSLGTQAVRSGGWAAGQGGDLQAQSLSTPITFLASAAAPTHYAYSFTDALVVKDTTGTQVGSGPINVSLIAPSVYAYFTSPSGNLNLAQGETATINVNLTSSNGLNGPVTVNLSGLPEGVTVVPETVQVTPSGATIATLTLSATTSAALGSKQIALTTSVPNQTSSQTTINVVPQRLRLDGSFQRLLTASQGIWVVAQPGGYGNTTYAATRYLKSVPQNTVNVAGPSSGSVAFVNNNAGLLFSGSDDDLKYDYGLLTSVTDDGNVRQFTLPHRIAQDIGTGNSTSKGGVLDGNGNLWYLRASVVNGNSTLSLVKLQSDGTEVAVDSEHNYVSCRALNISNDGKTIIASGYNCLISISTENGSVNIQATNTGYSPVSVANDGSFWSLSYSSLSHVSPAGTLISSSPMNADSIIGLDIQNPNILWLLSHSQVIKFNTLTGVSASVSIGTIADPYYSSRSVLNHGGGVDVVTIEYPGGTGTFYLTHLD